MSRFRENVGLVWLSFALFTLGLLLSSASPASAADSDAGQKIFKKNCAMCHGAEGAGDGPMGKMLKPPPPSFTDAERMAQRPDEELITRIKEGKKPMPSYDGRLSDSQIQDILAFIRSLSAK